MSIFLSGVEAVMSASTNPCRLVHASLRDFSWNQLIVQYNKTRERVKKRGTELWLIM